MTHNPLTHTQLKELDLNVKLGNRPGEVVFQKPVVVVVIKEVSNLKLGQELVVEKYDTHDLGTSFLYLKECDHWFDINFFALKQ